MVMIDVNILRGRDNISGWLGERGGYRRWNQSWKVWRYSKPGRFLQTVVDQPVHRSEDAPMSEALCFAIFFAQFFTANKQGSLHEI